MDEEEQVAFPLVALFRKTFEEMHLIRKKYKGLLFYYSKTSN